MQREQLQQPIEKISSHDEEMLSNLYEWWGKISIWLITQIRPIYGQILDIQKQRAQLEASNINTDQKLQRELKSLQKDLKTLIENFPLPPFSEIIFESERLSHEISTTCQREQINSNNLESMLLEKLSLTTLIDLTRRDQIMPFRIDEWMDILSSMIVTLKQVKDKFQSA